MASKVSGVIEYIQPGGSSGTKYAIAATAYGVCDTAASKPIKNVDMTGFKLQEGMTVHIKFTNANSVSNPKLKFNSEADTNAKPIVQYGTTAAGITEETDGWYAGAVLTLTYDGTSWVRDQGFNTNVNTWRGVENSLTSDSTSVSLSAAQGKALKGLIDAMDATTPTASGNATAFIDSITQTDGKITSITKKNIPVASTSTAGIIKIGTAATDAMAGNTAVNKVKQNNNTENKEFSILLKTSNNTTDETGEVKFVKNYDVTVNPSTGRLSATSFMVDSHVTLQWNSTDSSLDFIFA